MPATYKRIIEERLVHEIFSGDYFVKDHATEGTTRILVSEFIDLVLADSATEEDLETAVHNFVPEYDSGTSYSVGNYCIYLNELYRCTTATTGDFDDSDWTATNAMSELVSLVSAEATARTTAINNEAYYRSMSDIVLSEDIAEPYNTTKSYVVGDIVSYNLYIYRCTGATTGTWDASKWEQVTVDELFDALNFSADAISYDNTSSGLEADNVQDAIDETITKLSAVGTASGDIATFPDGSDLSMPKLEVAIEPQQDLHGYDAPWVGGAGKNKLPLIISDIKSLNTSGTWNGNTYTINNVAFTIQTDDGGNVIGIATNGIANSEARIVVCDKTLNLGSSEYYTLSGCPSGGGDSTYNVGCWRTGSGSITEIGNGQTFSYSEPIRFVVSVNIKNGTNSANKLFQPMIESGSTKTSFAPYSNICPISGWDEVNVGVVGKNLYKAELNNYYLDVATGLPIAQVGYEISGFIPILANQSIYIPGSGSSRRWFYDKFKNPKTYLNNSDAQTYTAQEDGYIRVTLNKTISTYSTYQIEYGSTATAYKPYNGHTYTIDLDGTRYGGKVDLVSGVLTVDRAYVDLGTLNYSYYSGNLFTVRISDLKPVSNDELCNALCSIYVAKKGNEYASIDGSFVAGFNNAPNLAIHDSRFTDATAFKTAMNGVQLVYELATPLTIQLTPTVVKSLRGKNNVYADCGAILDAEYIRDMTIVLSNINIGGGKMDLLASSNSVYYNQETNISLSKSMSNYDVLMFECNYYDGTAVPSAILSVDLLRSLINSRYGYVCYTPGYCDIGYVNDTTIYCRRVANVGIKKIYGIKY